MSENLDEKIKDAFAIVRKTFNEFGTMMLDFEAELKKRDSKLQPAHTGNGIATEASKNLKNGDRWIHPFIARYYSFGGKEITNWYTAAGMVHQDHDNSPIEPKFIMGVILKTEPKERYKSWWLSSMYSSNIKKSTDEYAFENGINDCKWYVTIPDKGDENFGDHWYDKGFYCSKNLTEISNWEEVAKLANELNNFFSHVKNNH